MPRMRTIKPDFCASESIVALTIPCRLHFAMLWTYADDAGRGADNPRLIKAALWPLDDDVTTEHVDAWQAELAAKGRIVRYEADGRRYFEVVNFTEHQKPQKKVPTKLPAPEDGQVIAPSEPPTVVLRDSYATEPVALPPVGEGRGEVGVGVGGEGGVEETPSQSDSRPPEPVTDAPRGTRQERGDAALRLLGNRQADKALNVPGQVRSNPEGYRQSCIDGVIGEHGPRAHRLAHEHPTWPPERIADELGRRTNPGDDWVSPKAMYEAQEAQRRARQAEAEEAGVACDETVRDAAARAREAIGRAS